LSLVSSTIKPLIKKMTNKPIILSIQFGKNSLSID